MQITSKLGIITCFVFGLSVSHALAGFSLAIQAGPLTNAEGDAFPGGSLLVFVADLGRNGVLLPNPSSFSPGADDLVLTTSRAQDFLRMSIAFLFHIDERAAGEDTSSNLLLDEGDPIAMFWFPELTQHQYLTDPLDDKSWDLSAGPGKGISFGSFNTDASDSRWIVPINGSTVTLCALSASLGGAEPQCTVIPREGLRATHRTIPEPSTALLLFGACLLLSCGFSRTRTQEM